MRNALFKMTQFKSAECLLDNELCLCSTFAKIERAKGNIFSHSCAEQLIIGILKQQAGALPHFEKVFFASALVTKSKNAARLRFSQSHQQMQKG